MAKKPGKNPAPKPKPAGAPSKRSKASVKPTLERQHQPEGWPQPSSKKPTRPKKG